MTTQINDSIIYLPESNIDNETKQLVKNMSKSEVFEHIRVIPDCH